MNGTSPERGRGGTSPPGETPPAEGGLSGAGPEDKHNPTRGWAAGPLIALAVIVVLFMAFFVAYAVQLAL